MPSSEISKFYYVYTLFSHKHNQLYIGSTSNLIKRFKQHNAGKSYSTRQYVPWRLIYYEACLNKTTPLEGKGILKHPKADG